MIRTAATLLILSVAAGCVTTGTAPADVDAFKGQRGAPLLAKLGKPDSQEATAAGTVYRWRTQVLQEAVPVRTATTDYSSGLPRTVETTTFQQERQSCTLVLVVDAAGMVSDFSRNGSRQACAPLLAKLTSP
jgi:hypothetical protein